MKKVGVVLLMIIVLSVSVSAFSLTGYFSSLFSAQQTTITGTQANPIKVYPGQSLNILVAFEDPNGIESAVAYFPFEGGEDKVDMILSAGDENKGTFSATWVVHDTINMKWYKTKVVLTNSLGTETITYVDWQDPTQDHPAEQVRPGVFGQNYIGNYSFVNGSVGIGTTAPNEKLVVQSAITGGTAIIGNATGVGGGSGGEFYGIIGQTNSTYIGAAGVYGVAYSTVTGSSSYGVYGRAEGSQGAGVVGYASGSGTSQKAAVQGTCAAGISGCYSGYFSGGLGVYSTTNISAASYLTATSGFKAHSCTQTPGDTGVQACPTGKYMSAMDCDENGWCVAWCCYP